MKTLVKTKLLEGKYAELREYEMFKLPIKVIHCKDRDYKNHSHRGDEYMILTVVQQKKGKVVNTLQSKFPPYSYYRMYKFLWKAKGKIEVTQIDNKQIEYRGNTAII